VLRFLVHLSVLWPGSVCSCIKLYHAYHDGCKMNMGKELVDTLLGDYQVSLHSTLYHIKLFHAWHVGCYVICIYIYIRY